MIEWRLAGAFLIVAGAAGMGMAVASRQKQRLEDCREVLQFLLLLKTELRCTGACLSDAFCIIAEKMPESWNPFLHALSERMQNRDADSLESLWAECCSTTLEQTCLTAEDLIRFSRIGRRLGCQDLELQLKLLDLEIQEQESFCAQLAKELPVKCRISRSLGLFGGMMLAVMLL